MQVFSIFLVKSLAISKKSRTFAPQFKNNTLKTLKVMQNKYENELNALCEKYLKVITDEIIQIVSKSTSQCGGGTDVDAAISAMVDNVVLTLNNEEKEAKDDVHVVITDGQFDYRHVESKIFNAVKDATKNFAAAELAPKHTFWMIYDANENLIDAYKKEIKKGTVIFINSSTVIGNG